MKNVKRIALYSLIAAFGAAFFASCSTSNDVVNNSLIQKRKYRPGFYLNKKADKNEATVSVERAEVALGKTISAPEIVIPQRKTNLKVIEREAERLAEKKTKSKVKELQNGTRQQHDLRRAPADFTTGVATTALVQRRAMDESLKKAIIFSAVATGSLLVGALVASILYAITLSLAIYYLFLALFIALAIVCAVFAIINWVEFFKTL